MPLPLPRTLSPSKVASFKECALAFRFSAIDRLPEPPSMPAVKGTTVHRALELLFVADVADRTPEHARRCLDLALGEMAADPDYVGLDLDQGAADEFAADAARMVERYFSLENPVEYLKGKHGDLASAAQALGQPQARSWQELTPLIK